MLLPACGGAPIVVALETLAWKRQHRTLPRLLSVWTPTAAFDPLRTFLRPTYGGAVWPARMSIVSVALAVSACSSSTPVKRTVSPANPSEGELRAYVAEHWAEYGSRFSRFAARPRAPSTLVSVSRVVCAPYYSVSECSFEITARFEDGALITRVLRSQFDRNSSDQLRETILIVHERR